MIADTNYCYWLGDSIATLTIAWPSFADDEVILVLWLVKGLCLRDYNFIIQPQKSLVDWHNNVSCIMDEAIPYKMK